jgi:hypothetical protein
MLNDTPEPACGVWLAVSAGVLNRLRYRGSRGGDVTIERRGGDAEAVRDLSDADVGIGQHRLGGLNVVVREFRRAASCAPSTPRRR